MDSRTSTVQFTWSYGGLSDETGIVKTVHGIVNLNESVPEQSDVTVTIPADSLTTEDKSTEEMLKGAGFFDVAHYPVISFASDSIMQLDDEKDQLSGHLTMRGKTRPITLDVQFQKEELDAIRAGKKSDLTLSAQTAISRSAYGMEDYSGFIADIVTISITAHFKKIASSPAK